MTLIALRTGEDFAEVLTDTLTYSVGEAEFIQTDKVTAFPALRALLTAKGPAELHDELAFQVATYGGYFVDDSIDGLNELIMDRLPGIWDEIEKDPGTRERGWTYLVGWSPSHNRFVALEYDSKSNFEPHEVGRSELFTNPASDRTIPALSSAEEWATVGEALYEECSVRFGERTMIGGDLYLTRLEKDGVSQRRLLTLPDDDWRFRQMVIGTMHRYGQLGPCPCGSGQPYVVCHLLAGTFSADWPCPCQSGKPFRGCHRVEVNDPASFQHWIEHAEDFERTREPLRAIWRERFPDEPEPTPPTIVGRHKLTSPPDASPAPAPAAVLLSRRERREAARRANRQSR